MEPAESDPQARGPCVLPVQRIPLTPWESQLFRGYRGRRRADCAHSISGSTSCSAASLTKSGSVKSKSSGFGFTRRKLESWEPEVPAMNECEYPSFPQPPTNRGRAGFHRFDRESGRPEKSGKARRLARDTRALGHA